MQKHGFGLITLKQLERQQILYFNFPQSTQTELGVLSLSW